MKKKTPTDTKKKQEKRFSSSVWEGRSNRTKKINDPRVAVTSTLPKANWPLFFNNQSVTTSQGKWSKFSFGAALLGCFCRSTPGRGGLGKKPVIFIYKKKQSPTRSRGGGWPVTKCDCVIVWFRYSEFSQFANPANPWEVNDWPEKGFDKHACHPGWTLPTPMPQLGSVTGSGCLGKEQHVVLVPAPERDGFDQN